MSINSIPSQQQRSPQTAPVERVAGDSDKDDPLKSSAAGSLQQTSSQPTASVDTSRGQNLSVSA